MFSDSRAPAPVEQKGFKPHAPHFIPWLRKGLKPHNSSTLGRNGSYKSNSEVRNNLTPSEKTRGIGIFSFQGRDKSKKGELRCNGVGMARMLPVVLRGHHILPGSLGKQREDSPARSKESPELDPDPNTQGLDSSSTSAQNNHVFVRNQGSHLNLSQPQPDGTGTSAKKYGPLVGPPPIPVPTQLAEGPECKVPVVTCMEDRRGKVWDYTSHTIHRRDLHSSSWMSSDTQGLIEGHHGFRSSFSYMKRNSQSQRDLTALSEPPVGGFSGALNGVIFSTEVPHRGLGFTTTLRGPRQPRQNSKRTAVLGQNQTWVQHRANTEGEPQRKEACCSRKVVRNQIKRVVDNLEQVLAALRDVHLEMKEVVQQIDNLTLCMDLTEEEQQQTGGGDRTKPSRDSSFTSGSSFNDGMVGSTHQRPSEPEDQPRTTGTLRRDHRTGSRSPPNVLLCPLTLGLPSQRTQTRFSCSSPRRGGLLPYASNLTSSVKSNKSPQLQNLTSHDLTLSPQRSLPVRPPTPGLSPLTVHLHHPSSPSSHSHSPGASPSITVSPVSPPSQRPHPPVALSPSVIIETPQSDHPCAGSLCPSLTRTPSASCPPTNSETHTVSNTDRERRASSAGPAHRPSQDCAAPTATAKPPTAQGRRGRKPPPYPHHKLCENAKTVKEPRKAPPYPEKRRLLSTTV